MTQKEMMFWAMGNIGEKHIRLSVDLCVFSKFDENQPRIKLAKKTKDNYIFLCDIYIDSLNVEGDCKINSKELEKVKQWVKVNQKVLLDLWYMNIDHVEAFENLNMSVFEKGNK